MRFHDRGHVPPTPREWEALRTGIGGVWVGRAFRSWGHASWGHASWDLSALLGACFHCGVRPPIPDYDGHPSAEALAIILR